MSADSLKTSRHVPAPSRGPGPLLPGVPWSLARTFVVAALLLVMYRFTCLERFYFDEIRPRWDGGERLLPGLAATAWKALATTTLLMGVPVAIVRFVDQIPLAQAGLAVGRARVGIRFVTLFWAAMLPVLIGASFLPAFRFKYPLAPAAADSLTNLLVYELLMLVYFFGWEFFFRGYFLFMVERHIGHVAVFVQMVPFALLHGNKPLPEALGAVLVGIVLGVFALRTRTFLYCTLVHFAVSATMDIMAIVHRGGWGVHAG
ncbi:MAG: CPBP family intramembrane glutamic endopeptidase [Polyangiaceae bacterium]